MNKQTFIILLFLCSSVMGGYAAPEEDVSNAANVPRESVTPNQPVIIVEDVIVEEPKESNVKWVIGAIVVPIVAVLIPILILRNKKH